VSISAPEPPPCRAPSARPPGPPLLAVEGLTVAYGKAEVVHGVSLEVRKGELVALLGRNGAGKSTVLNAVSGLIGKRAGSVRIDGREMAAATPRAVVRAGLVQVLEGHRVFTTLSVEDNILLGTYAKHPRGGRRLLDRAYALFPELAGKRHEPASRLSGGQQQILAVAQGIAGEPRLLMLDEPSGGLAPILVDRILDVASALCRDEGVGVLLVEQLVEKALRRAGHAYLLETGRIAGGGPAAEVAGSDLLRRVYLGDHGRA
jgi:branched-chain amino acid transport system ATP-binding protein